MKKSLSLLLISICSFLLVPLALADGLTITPPKFEYTVDPGEVIEGIVKLTNSGSEMLYLTSDVQDFVAGNETGTPSFVSDADSSISLRSWITVNDNQPVSIAAGEKVEIPFVINVPSEAEPGGHYGAIFFQPPAGEGQVAVVQKIGALVLIRVAGEIREEGNLDYFGTYGGEMSDDPIDDLSTASFFENFPVNFALRFENTGNTHVKPTGKIEISSFGQNLANIGVETVTNSQGVIIDQNIVDYIPVNDMRGNSLANSFRRFDTTYQGEAYWYRNDDGTKEIRYRGLPMGYYTAKLTLDYGSGNDQIVREVSFILLPWKQVGLGIIALVLVIFLFIKYRSWSRARMKAQLMAEMQKTKKKPARKPVRKPASKTRKIAKK